MKRWLADRELRQVKQRLDKARARLATVEAETSVLSEQSDEDQLRALVSEDGLSRAEAGESGKHAAAARRELSVLRNEIATLERRLDDLLDRRS